MADLSPVYARHAARFDRVRAGSSMERRYLDEAAGLAPAPGRVLDLGCGSGEPIARYFVERGYEVTGVDLVDEMLAIARTRFPQMRWVRADMRRLALQHRFDIVIAWDSFFHLSRDDQRSMFETFARHTMPGGVLVFTSGTEDGEALGGDLFGDVLYHASLDTREYRRLLDLNGYTVLSHYPDAADCGDHTIWIAQRRITRAEAAASGFRTERRHSDGGPGL